MISFFAVFVAATAIALALTPLARRVGLYLGALSAPGGRHVHGTPVPRSGGLAVGVAVLLPILGLLAAPGAAGDHLRQHLIQVVGLCVGAAALGVLGFVDDTRRVRPSGKLAVQLAVAVLAYACGFRIELISLPFIGELPMGALSLPVTLLWLVGVTNAVNLIDGLDGLAAGVVFIAGMANLVVAVRTGSFFAMVMLAAMLGAVLAFLFYNFNPARIFLGDSGSYLLGFVLAATALTGATSKTSTAIAVLVPVVALGLPILDTLLALLRRWLAHRPLFSPDRGHIHHRLLEAGITHRRAVLLLYAVSVILTLAAIVVHIGQSWQVGLALLVTFATMGALLRFAGSSRRATRL